MMNIIAMLLVCTTFMRDTYLDLVARIPVYNLPYIHTIGSGPASPPVAVTQSPRPVHFATYTEASAIPSIIPSGNSQFEYISPDFRKVCFDFEKPPIKAFAPPEAVTFDQIKQYDQLGLTVAVLLTLFAVLSLVYKHRLHLLATLSITLKPAHSHVTNNFRDLGIVNAGTQSHLVEHTQILVHDPGRVTCIQTESAASIDIRALCVYLAELHRTFAETKASKEEEIDHLKSEKAGLQDELQTERMLLHFRQFSGILYPSEEQTTRQPGDQSSESISNGNVGKQDQSQAGRPSLQEMLLTKQRDQRVFALLKEDAKELLVNVERLKDENLRLHDTISRLKGKIRKCLFLITASGIIARISAIWRKEKQRTILDQQCRMDELAAENEALKTASQSQDSRIPKSKGPLSGRRGKAANKKQKPTKEMVEESEQYQKMIAEHAEAIADAEKRLKNSDEAKRAVETSAEDERKVMIDEGKRKDGIIHQLKFKAEETSQQLDALRKMADSDPQAELLPVKIGCDRPEKSQKTKRQSHTKIAVLERQERKLSANLQRLRKSRIGEKRKMIAPVKEQGSSTGVDPPLEEIPRDVSCGDMVRELCGKPYCPTELAQSLLEPEVDDSAQCEQPIPQHAPQAATVNEVSQNGQIGQADGPNLAVYAPEDFRKDLADSSSPFDGTHKVVTEAMEVESNSAGEASGQLALSSGSPSIDDPRQPGEAVDAISGKENSKEYSADPTTLPHNPMPLESLVTTSLPQQQPQLGFQFNTLGHALQATLPDNSIPLGSSIATSLPQQQPQLGFQFNVLGHGLQGTFSFRANTQPSTPDQSSSGSNKLSSDAASRAHQHLCIRRPKAFRTPQTGVRRSINPATTRMGTQEQGSTSPMSGYRDLSMQNTDTSAALSTTNPISGRLVGVAVTEGRSGSLFSRRTCKKCAGSVKGPATYCKKCDPYASNPDTSNDDKPDNGDDNDRSDGPGGIRAANGAQGNTADPQAPTTSQQEDGELGQSTESTANEQQRSTTNQQTKPPTAPFSLSNIQTDYWSSKAPTSRFGLLLQAEFQAQEADGAALRNRSAIGPTASKMPFSAGTGQSSIAWQSSANASSPAQTPANTYGKCRICKKTRQIAQMNGKYLLCHRDRAEDGEDAKEAEDAEETGADRFGAYSNHQKHIANAPGAVLTSQSRNDEDVVGWCPQCKKMKSHFISDWCDECQTELYE